MLTPTGPNRTAAQRRSGSGRYTSAGMLPSPAVGQAKTRTLTATSPPPIRQASIQRAGDAFPWGARALAIQVQVRIAGASIRYARASERNQTRQ